jgi:hypothetical protein
MTTTSARFPLCLVALAIVALPLAACNDAATTVFVANGSADLTVSKVWWNATLIPESVAPRRASAVQRAVPGDDFAYALLAPLIPARSAQPLSVARGDQLEILVSDDTFVGDCAAGEPLDADTAQLIVERIFPGDFAGATYDPVTCTTTPASADAAQGQ